MYRIPAIHSDFIPNELKRMCVMPVTTKQQISGIYHSPTRLYPTAPILSQKTSNFTNHARGERKLKVNNKMNVTLHNSFSVNGSSFPLKLRKKTGN
jgi:hypothetical protein